MEKQNCKKCVKQYLCDFQKCDFIPYTKIKNYGEIKKDVSKNVKKGKKYLTYYA